MEDKKADEVQPPAKEGESHRCIGFESDHQLKTHFSKTAINYAKNEKIGLLFGINALYLAKHDGCETIVEAGCGTGLCTDFILHNHITHRPEKPLKLIPFDLSEAMLQMCKARVETYQLSTNTVCSPQIGNVEDLVKIPSESVDLYISNFVLHIVSNPRRMLDEAARVLKKDGTLAVVVNGRHDESTVFSYITKAGQELNHPELEMLKFFTMGQRDVMEPLLEKAGFKIKLFTYQNVACDYENFDDYNARVLESWFKNRGLTPEQGEEVGGNIRRRFEEDEAKGLPILMNGLIAICKKSS